MEIALLCYCVYPPSNTTSITCVGKIR